MTNQKTEKTAQAETPKVIVVNHDARSYYPSLGPKGQLWLKPGTNFVDAKIWEKLANDEFTQNLIKNQQLEELKIGDEETGRETTNLSEMNVKKAVALIKLTMDRHLLRDWEVDERTTVKKAIATQLELLDGSKAA